MFAIIDIETCGSKYEFQRGRIIEICVLVHDGLQVTEKFSTLINPECYISPYFIRISNITNEMVADAPKFHEVAKKILELTEGRIFIAHNVGFDYNFIKEEFASLGYKFRRETLCTVKLSRKLLPGKFSYNLGNLCSSLGIENEARHRAEGDAVATAKLFDLLLQVKSQCPQYKNIGVGEIMATRIDKIKQYILNKLPEECGVYYFLDKDQNIIYIGKSTNMYNRALSHFNTREQKGRKMLHELFNVDYVSTGSELIALLLESSEIKKHKPKFNRMRKAGLFTHCIDWFKDEKEIINFRIVNYEGSENAVQSFNSYISARDRLEQWISDHTLCLRYCGLTNADSVCYNHQIKTCNGICNEQEDIELYNKRASEILQKHIYSRSEFVIIDKGRNNEERSVIFVEKGKYSGYGYFDNTGSISSVGEIREIVNKPFYYPDTDDLVRGWMRSNKGFKLLEIKNKRTDAEVWE